MSLYIKFERKWGKKSDQLGTRVRTLSLSLWFPWKPSRKVAESVGGKMKGTTRSAFFSRTLTRSYAWRIRPPLRLHACTCVTSTRRLAVFSASALIGRRHKRMKLKNTVASGKTFEFRNSRIRMSVFYFIQIFFSCTLDSPTFNHSFSYWQQLINCFEF